MNRRHSFLALVATLAFGALLRADNPVPLEDFFRDFTFAEIKISPDGTKVAALSTWKEHLNLYVIDLKTKRPTQLTGLTTMDVADVQWVGNDHLIFTGEEDGIPNGRLFEVDADGKRVRDLTESDKERRGWQTNRSGATEFLGFIGRGNGEGGISSEEILVVSNERSIYDPDVYRLNVRTRAKRMVARNPGDIRAWVADGRGVVRAGFGEKGREQFLIYRDSAKDTWREVKRWDFEKGGIEPLAFDKDDRLLYVKNAFERNTANICLFDPATGQIVKELFANDTYDADDVIVSRIDGTLLGFSYYGEKPETVWTDPAMTSLQQMIDQELPGSRNAMVSRSLDNTWVVIRAYSERDPGTFYLLNTKELAMEKLVSMAGWLKPDQMSEMKPITYPSRDGFTVHGYLTIPQGKAARDLPLIVFPHGGPWVRDGWGFNRDVQFLASRGYAVLQINFRGSTGYGGRWLQAGYGQWGLAMQDDITDGVAWAIEQGIADPRRVGIYGASYGGYAAMAGLAFTPELYCCGINYVGVTDLELLLRTLPKGWESTRAKLEAMTGNARTDRERLRATSPMLHADQIRAPVFFAYGELDDRIDLKHATKVASELRHRGIPIEWMTRSDEGHGYRIQKNKIMLYTAMEKFLAEHMAVKGTPTVTTGTPKVLEMPAVDKP